MSEAKSRFVFVYAVEGGEDGPAMIHQSYVFSHSEVTSLMVALEEEKRWFYHQTADGKFTAINLYNCLSVREA